MQQRVNERFAVIPLQMNRSGIAYIRVSFSVLDLWENQRWSQQYIFVLFCIFYWRSIQTLGVERHQRGLTLNPPTNRALIILYAIYNIRSKLQHYNV